MKSAIIYVKDWAEKMVLENFTKNTALFSREYDRKNIIVVDMDVDTLLNSEVFGFADPKVVIYNGDTLQFADGRDEVVEHVKEGDGSPYPIVTKEGQYKWEEFTMIHRGSSG